MKKVDKTSETKGTEFDFRTIKTIEDAFKRKEIPFESVKELEDLLKKSAVPQRFHDALVAVYELFVGHESINDTWKADFTKDSQPKYSPWARPNSSGSGFGFSYSGYLYDHSDTDVGSRLCNGSPEQTKHAFKVFEEQYKKFWL